MFGSLIGLAVRLALTCILAAIAAIVGYIIIGLAGLIVLVPIEAYLGVETANQIGLLYSAYGYTTLFLVAWFTFFFSDDLI